MKQPPFIVVQVVHIQGPMQGSIQEFSASEISLGRDPSCDICFPAELTIVSRRHAKISRDGNRFRLVDSSTNGTLLNGKPVKEAYLKDGDVITLALEGPKMSFLTRVEEQRANLSPQLPATGGKVPPVSQQPPPELAPDVEPIPVLKPIAGPGPGIERTPPPQSTPPPEPPVRSPERTEKAPLIVQYGPTLRSFDNLPIKVGRGSHCEVPLDMPGISEEQALFFFTEGRYWVKDLTGTGSVQVNGNPAGIGVPLNSEDRIVLSTKGPVFRFLGDGRLIEEEMPALNVRGSEAQESHPEKKPSERGSEKGKMSFLKKFFRDD